MQYSIKNIGDKIGLDLNYFIGNGFWVVGRYVLIGLCGLALSGEFTRFFSKQTYGQYQFILTIISLASIFSLPGFNILALREVGRGNFKAIKQVVKLSFLASWLALPLIVGYGIFKLKAQDPSVGYGLILAALIFPFYFAPNTWYTYFEGQALFKQASVRIIAGNIFIVMAMSVMFWLKGSLLWAVIVYLLANVVYNSFFYIKVTKKIKNKEAPLDYRYGFACTAQKFTFTLTDTLPALAVSLFYGYAYLATYQVAQYLLAMVVGFISALSATYLPLLFKYRQINLLRAVWQNLIIGIIICAGFLILIKVLFFVVYPAAYRDSFQLVNGLAFSVIIVPLRLFLINYLTSINRNVLVVIINVVVQTVALVAFYLIKENGFSGAVLVYIYSFYLLSTGLFLAVSLPASYGQNHLATTRATDRV